MSDNPQCSSVAGLILLGADGELDRDQLSRLEEHLGSCAHCRAQAGSVGLLDHRLLESRSILNELVPPTDAGKSEFIVREILSNQETWLERMVLALRPMPAIRVAAVLALAVVAAFTVLQKEHTRPGSDSPSETAEEVTVGAAEVQLDVPLAPVGDPFFDGSQTDAPARMSVALTADGQPRNLVLAK